MLALAVVAKGLYAQFIQPKTYLQNLDLKYQKMTSAHTGINPVMGKTLERVDPRIQHLAKWLMSVGDSVAAGDANNDGSRGFGEDEFFEIINNGMKANWLAMLFCLLLVYFWSTFLLTF